MINVGDKTVCIETPSGYVIYATNMMPERVERCNGETEEVFLKRLEETKRSYEQKRIAQSQPKKE